MLVEALTHSLELGPGETAVCRARVTNNSAVPARYAVRLHGLGPVGPYIRLGNDAVPPHSAIDFELPIVVPESFGAGDHGAAIEVRSDQRQEVPVIANFSVAIGTTDHISAQIVPSVLRTHRRGKFIVEVLNKRTMVTEVDLAGAAPNLQVRLEDSHVVLQPGETAFVKGRTKGARHIAGEPIAHVVTVETSANSTPSYSTASVQQRAVIPWKLRSGLVGLAILLVWVLIAVGGVLWFSNRNNTKTAAVPTTLAGGVAADGSTPLSTPASGSTAGSTATGAGTGGSAGAGGATAGATAGAGAGAGGAGGAPAVPALTKITGTVKAGNDGADGGVHITLTPTTPDEPTATTDTAGATEAATPGAAATGGGPGAAMVPAAALRAMVAAGAPEQHDEAADDPPMKRWPARFGTYSGANLESIRTFSVTSVSSGTDGAYQFASVPLHRSYELSFSKAGFITKSVIVNTPDESKPVQVDVQLLPGDGLIDGIVTSSGVGLGGVHVSATDGTVILQSTSSTDTATRGKWSLDGLSTPDTYTLTFTLDGYSTQVAQVVLAAGEQHHNLTIPMTAGVGSVAGTVRSDGNPIGGITITASAGDKTVSTTSLTEGALGTYDFPLLNLGQVYIITATADGFITQSRSVSVSGNETGIDFDLVSTTASITGQVFVKQETGTADPVPLVSAGVSVSANGLQVNKPTAATPVAGAFTIGDLPPGSYVVTISRYDTTAFSQLVTLVAGQTLDLGQIVVTHQAPPAIASTGSLIVRTIDALGQPINGATVVLSDVGGRRPPIPLTMGPAENAVAFNNIPIGTYNFTVAKNNYRPNTIGPISIGLTAVSKDVTMLQYGTARGTVINRLGGTKTILQLDDRGLPTFQDPLTGTTYVLDRAVTPVPAGAQSAYLDSVGNLIVGFADGTYLRSLAPTALPTQKVVPLTEVVGNQQLKNYRLLLYSTGATYGCIAVISVSDTEKPDPLDPYGRIQWQIDPSNHLLPGTYVLRFSPAPGDTGSSCAGNGNRLPPGYASVPIDADGNAATFTVAENSDAKIVVPPIALAPYPSVTGTVVVAYEDNNTFSFENFATADAATVSINLNCPGGATASGTVAAAGAKVAFTFSTTAIATLFANKILPDPAGTTCTLVVASSKSGVANPPIKFLPSSTPLTLKSGYTAYQDQVLSVALVQDPNTVTGNVYWQDKGVTPVANVPVAGFTITASGTTGFDTGKANDPDSTGPTVVTAPKPTPTPNAPFLPVYGAPSSFVFNGDGSRQVIGTANYLFSAPNFDAPPAIPTAMTVTANKSSSAVAWVATGPTVKQVGNNVSVLMAPNPGRIQGAVFWHNTFAAQVFGFTGLDQVRVNATPPGAATLAPIAVQTNGTYVQSPAAAGTWNFGYDVTAGSELLQYKPPASDTLFVPPGQSAQAPNVPFVTLGHVKVNLVDSNDLPILPSATGPAPSVTLQRNPADSTPSYPTAFTTRSTDVTTGSVDFSRLPIGDTGFFTQSLGYLLSATVPGYDSAPQSITVTDLKYGGTTVAGSLTNIPVRILEASNQVVTIKLRKLATITGTVTGHLLQSTKSLNNTADGLVVTATRTNCACALDGTSYIYDDRSPAPAGATYSIAVPAGDYVVTFTAPDYVTPASQLTTVGVGGVVTVNADMFLKTGALIMSTFSNVTPATFVAETVGLWKSSVADTALATTKPDYTFNTDGRGPFSLTGVYPGTYTIQVAAAGYFPVISTITVPQGPTDPLRTITRSSLTTLIDGEITGAVEAVNSAREAIALPSGAAATATFSGDSIRSTDPSVIANRATLAAVTQTGLTESAPGAGASFDLKGLPRGTNTVSFSGATGFSAPASRDVLVTGLVDTSSSPFIYTAADVNVEVTVTDAAGPVTTATVTLTPAVGTAISTSTATAAGVYSLVVPPRIGAYSVTVTAPLHIDGTPTTQIISPTASVVPIPVTLLQTATISGTIYEQTSSATPGTATGGIAVELKDAGNAVVGSTTSASSGLVGGYSFTVPAAGTYHVEVNSPPAGFSTGATGSFAVALGAQVTGKDISIQQFPSAALTLVGVPASTTDETVSVSPPAGVTKTPTGAGTSFTFSGLTAGTNYTFSATGTGLATQTFVITGAIPGQSYAHTFTWTALAGTLFTPGPGTDVKLTGPNGYTATRAFANTGSGAYAFTGLEIGNYTISATRAWDGVNLSVAFDLGAGSAVTNPNPSSLNPKSLTMPAVQSATLSGTVIDQGGTGVGGASVTLKNGATTISGPTPVGAGGAYSFNAGITSAGTYTIVASATGYVDGSTNVAVSSAATLTGRNVTVNALATATLTLTNPPSTVTSVSVSPAGPTTASSGSPFTFTGLVPGTAYTFTAGTLTYSVTPTAGSPNTHAFVWATAQITLSNAPASTVVNVSPAGPTTASSGSPFTYVGLLIGTQYTFTATNPAGATETYLVTPTASSTNTHTFNWTDVAGTVAGLTAGTGTATVVLSGASSATMAVTEASPGFHFTQLAPGTYTVTATDNSTTPKTKALVFTVNADGTTAPAQGTGAWTLTVA